jgi:DNA-binding transcriptional ArsR family regulator
MELDFGTLKALASSTRVRILHRLLEKEATPTVLSNDLDRSKSTISSHLTQLQNAGLVEKEKVEGRKRVVYRPTSKAKTIIKGRERRMKFAITSSLVSGLAGIGIFFRSSFKEFVGMQEQAAAAESFQTLSKDGAADAAASSGVESLAVVAVIVIVAAVVAGMLAGFYWWIGEK